MRGLLIGLVRDLALQLHDAICKVGYLRLQLNILVSHLL